MTTHHTPGPWEAREYGLTPILKTAAHGVIVGKGDGMIAFVPGNDKAECEARARLIASAPELLEALEAAYEELEGYAELLQKQGYTEDADAVEAVWRKARAATAKARGEQL
jgi:hypothetical protein